MTITRGKRYRKDAEKTSDTPVSLAEAVAKVKTFNSTKFDQTVQLIFLAGYRPEAVGPDYTRRAIAASRDRSAKESHCVLRRSRRRRSQTGGRHRGRCGRADCKGNRRLVGFRRGDCLNEGYGQGRQAGPGSWSAGQNALAQKRHGNCRRCYRGA